MGFGRPAAPEASPVEAAPEPPAPAPSREMRDSECLKPSSFASRAAKRRAEGRPDVLPPRLAQVGLIQVPVERPGRGKRGQVELIDVELWVDLDHTTRRYRRIVPHGVIEPMFDDSPPPRPEPSFTVRRHPDQPLRSGYYPEPTPEPPPRPVI